MRELERLRTHRDEILAIARRHGAKETRPDIPWREIAGFRNVIVHDYLSVDQDVVWSIIERDVSPLEEAVRMMLSD